MTSRLHRWQLPLNCPVFTVVIIIFHYIDRIEELLLPPIFCITYTIIKNIIQVNQVIYTCTIINIYYRGEQLGNCYQKRVRINYHYFVVMENE